MAEEPKDAGVDETPISPVKSLERRNSLEKQLQVPLSHQLPSPTHFH
jgi:hypothetical protein